VEVTATRHCGKYTLLQKAAAPIGPQSTAEYNNPYYAFPAERHLRK